MHTSFCVTGVVRSDEERSTRTPSCARSVRVVGVVPCLPDVGAEPTAVGYLQADGAGPGAHLGGARLGRWGCLIEFGDDRSWLARYVAAQRGQ